MKIAVIDIETTGFLKEGGKIVEVGIVSLDLDTGHREIVFDSLCHERPITYEEVSNSWIVKNNYITVEEVQYSPQFSLIKEDIQAVLDAHPDGATAFNKQFDFDFLKSRGIKFQKEVKCPMLAATPVCKIKADWGFKWPKVEEAWEHFFGDTGYVEKHRGADDALHEAAIVYELYKIGKL